MQLWEYCSLRQTEQGLVYTLYRARRYTLTLVSQGQDSETLARYSAQLGLIGWQATPSDSGDEHLHFKRLLRSEQHELDISGQSVKNKAAGSVPCRNAFRPQTPPREGRLLLSPDSNDVKVRF